MVGWPFSKTIMGNMWRLDMAEPAQTESNPHSIWYGLTFYIDPVAEDSGLGAYTNSLIDA